MRKLSPIRRSAVLAGPGEGMGINAVARVCGVSKLSVLRLLADIGSLCRDLHDLMVRGLRWQRVHVDEAVGADRAAAGGLGRVGGFGAV